MTVVIADDFAGAAEIAGIGLRYNLDIELFMSSLAVNDVYTDLFVMCTDSRSLNKEDAKKITGHVAQEIEIIKPDHIYKKIDSVFRGHVLDELKIEMKLLGLKRALIIAANPSLGRTIKNGKYFINGIPVDQTDFATDPDFPITSSSVLEMVKATPGEVKVLKHTDDLPDEGIILGEAVSAEEIEAWVKKVDNSWLLAGAGDFFTALLNRVYKASVKSEVFIELPHLYVSGTAFEKRQTFIKEIEKKLSCVAYLPVSMMQGDSKDDETWFNNVNKILRSQKRVIVAINKNENINPGISALSLRIAMAKAVRKIIESGEVKELFIEGGSTAAAILNELNITTLSPVNELQRGVVRMKTGNLYITVKPGSYELPEQIEKLYLVK